MNSFILILLCLMGLCWGSFLNVLMARTLSGESIIFPFSKCPKCGHSLYFWHNIPIVSFLILKGKCYFCNKTISLRYPIVEIIGLALFLFSFTKYISIFDAISVIIALSMFIVLSYTDIKERKISVIQTLFIILAGVVFNRYDIYNSLAGCVVGAAIVLFISFLGKKVFNKEIFGAGDIYLLGALGSVVGFDKIFLFLVYTLIAQFVMVLPSYILSLIRAEQIKTLKYLIFFIVACLFLYFFRNISFWGSNALLTVILGFVIFFAYHLIRNLFNTLKTGEIASYCPLAPAVAISCIIFLC